MIPVARSYRPDYHSGGALRVTALLDVVVAVLAIVAVLLVLSLPSTYGSMVQLLSERMRVVLPVVAVLLGAVVAIPIIN